MKNQTLVMDPTGKPEKYTGTVSIIKGDYAFVSCPPLRGDIFLHRNEFINGEWSNLAVGDLLSFLVGFTYRGPVSVKATMT